MKKRPTSKIQVVSALSIADLQRQIDEWERFADHLLITLGVGKEPMTIKFMNDKMTSVMNQLRRYYPQMGITEMINDVRKEKEV